MISWVGEIKITPAPTPSLEDTPSKNIFQTEVLGGGSSQEVMDYILISIGG
jgi:hypothetical protein